MRFQDDSTAYMERNEILDVRASELADLNILLESLHRRSKEQLAKYKLVTELQT